MYKSYYEINRNTYYYVLLYIIIFLYYFCVHIAWLRTEYTLSTEKENISLYVVLVNIIYKIVRVRYGRNVSIFK